MHMSQLTPLPLTVSCFSKIQIGFTFLVPAHLGSPGKRAVKRVCVRVSAWICIAHNSLEPEWSRFKVGNNYSCVFNFCVCDFCFIIDALCLQCFDAVGWAAGRASGL